MTAISERVTARLRSADSPLTARPSLTRAVLQIVLVVVGAACGVWALYRLAFVILVVTIGALFA
jgi:hypothetical protein